VQVETAIEHVPPLQKFEQQSPLPAQGLPEVRQFPPGLTLAHLPPLQMPLQQSPFWPQAPATGVSGTHCLFAQILFTHEPVQQSGAAAHAAPGSSHVLLFGSPHAVPTQLSEQQSAAFAHVAPLAAQTPASFTEASVSPLLLLPLLAPLLAPLEAPEEPDDAPEDPDDAPDDEPSLFAPSALPSGPGIVAESSPSLPQPANIAKATDALKTPTRIGNFRMGKG
jgi:hypothetical protein